MNAKKKVCCRSHWLRSLEICTDDLMLARSELLKFFTEYLAVMLFALVTRGLDDFVKMGFHVSRLEKFVKSFDPGNCFEGKINPCNYECLSVSAGKIMSGDENRHFKTKRQFRKKGSRELDASPHG
jgi:hypothetical protein